MDREVKRKIIHVAAAVAAVPFLLLFDLLLGVVVCAVGLAAITLVWHLEDRGEELAGPAAQGQRVLAKTMEEAMRPEERFPWAPFWFVGGLLAVAAASEATGAPLSLAFAAYAILGIGDAASALIGMAYGSIEIPWNPDKSLEGTGAGLGAAYPWALMLAAVYELWIEAPGVGGELTFPIHMVWIVFVGAVVGLLAETLPGEDNFTIPILSWIAMAAAAWTVGIV